ncbi:MAG: hypothetical protein KDI42_11300, partial [Gammaproteobacteria bacterium]|nr:hypothetical protein [Gammaproteobacteria bacterium]
AWRTRTIYETNLRASYGAGRWAQAQRTINLRPYGIYKHSDAVVTPRPLHLKWDGLILRLDDPWVATHWTPNGWGCKCKWFTLSERDLQRMGRGVDTAPDDGTREWTNPYTGELHDVPNGIDPGWDYAPGASRVDLLRERYRAKADGYEQRFAGETGQRLAQYLREAIVIGLTTTGAG